MNEPRISCECFRCKRRKREMVSDKTSAVIDRAKRLYATRLRADQEPQHMGLEK